MRCPCGSNLEYVECCGLYIDGQQLPASPEALMRSRYTAYTQANVAYIAKTMTGKAVAGFDEADARRWAQRVTWLDLQVIKTSPVQNNLGTIEFIARLIDNQRLVTIHETSEFCCQAGRWYYVDGILIPQKNHDKLSRNAPCPCGNGKKLKHCHK